MMSFIIKALTIYDNLPARVPLLAWPAVLDRAVVFF